MATILLVILTVPVVVLAVVLGVHMSRSLKGNMVVTLGTTNFRPGHDISGVVTVTAKKELGPGRLSTALVCIEEWWEWQTDSDGDRRREHKTREIYRHEVVVEGHLTVPAGSDAVKPFVIGTPQPQDSVAPDPDQPGWQRALLALADAFSNERDTYWELRTRYDIKGLDLRSEQRIPLVYDVH